MKDSRVAQALEALDGADLTAADSAACAVLLGDVKRVRGWLDATEAKVSSRMRELHATAGAAPAADQHSRCGGVSAGEGRRKDRRAEAIEQAPSFGEALAEGTIGAEHVDALANATSRLDDDVRGQLLGHEDDLLDDATRMTPEQFARSCRDLIRRLERDNGIERNRRQRHETFLSRKLNAASGMIEGRFAFHPELADQVFGAVDREVAAMVAEGERKRQPEFVRRTVDRNRLAAEALGRLVAGGHDRIRPLAADITYLVDHRSATTGRLHERSICETGSGLPVPPTSIARALCDGSVTPVIVDADGVVLDAGRTIRHPNRQQRRALRAMYRTCAIGDCDVPFDRCEIHHILPWELGGRTDLRDLIPACARHHHLVHDLGWRLDLSPDRTLTITDRDGTTLWVTEPDVPPERSEGPPGRGHRRTAA
jgi:hypothetical protein